MLKDYLPIPLIPAAWLMTFATMVYPGIDTYWIQHMHLFITSFLAVFAVLSWKQMNEGALKTWRSIILMGIIFTGIGALSFYTESYSQLMAGSSLLYWFLAPGAGFKVTAEAMNLYSDLFKRLAWTNLVAALVLIAGYAEGSMVLIGISIMVVAVVQTMSIVLAAKADN